MHEQGKQLLQLMFRDGETICVSPNKYGYHSLDLETVLTHKEVTLVPTQASCDARKLTLEEALEKCDTDTLLLAALNPIKGFREDANCYKYRNFLVEMDIGPLAQQLEYVKTMKMPYSAAIFSGNKSLHFLISLDTDLPDEDTYRLFSKWILTIMTLADQNTVNPSRSIRIPGAWREPDKRQLTAEFHGAVKLQDIADWLSLHPDAKPRKAEKQKISDTTFPSFIEKPKNKWIRDALLKGIDSSKGRNKQWFSIACEFVLAGFSLDDTLSLLDQFFVPDRDFKEREWKTIIKSAFKHMKARK